MQRERAKCSRTLFEQLRLRRALRIFPIYYRSVIACSSLFKFGTLIRASCLTACSTFTTRCIKLTGDSRSRDETHVGRCTQASRGSGASSLHKRAQNSGFDANAIAEQMSEIFRQWCLIASLAGTVDWRARARVGFVLSVDDTVALKRNNTSSSWTMLGSDDAAAGSPVKPKQLKKQSEERRALQIHFGSAHEGPQGEMVRIVQQRDRNRQNVTHWNALGKRRAARSRFKRSVTRITNAGRLSLHEGGDSPPWEPDC